MSTFRKVIFALFFLSGFCGLLYQVIWLRLAFAHFGIITPVLSVVVSVFMLGLALGSWAGGAWITRAQGQFSAVYAYALTEGLIGVGAFVVPKFFQIGDAWLLPGGETNSLSYLASSGLAITASLLPWCFLMGATFPLMMEFIRQRESAHDTSFSFLYIANVIGAMCGTILTADVLVELLGFRNTLMVAGLTNFLIAAISVALGVRSRNSAASRKDFLAGPGGDAVPIERGRTAAWIYGILFATGFTSMSLEVIWVRDFTPVLGTTVYAFAFVVALYLLATWLGSAAYRRQAARYPVLPVAELLAALAISTLFIIAINDPRLHLRQAGVALGIFPFCFLLGYLTPGLIDRYAHGDPKHAGRAYAVNIVGCILGPLAASYLFLPWLGAKVSMILMALPYVALFAVSSGRLKLAWRSLAGVLVAGLLICTIRFNRSYEDGEPGGVIRRDATATVISLGSGIHKRLLVNGIGITELTTITKIMAHFPLMVLHKPTDALDICFGMGTTYRSLLRWPGLQVTAVELVPSVKQAVGYYHADAAALMANPRGHVVIDDGRRFLRRSSQQFDLITIDPPPPIEAAGSSLLYAKEFYTIIRQRLKPGGILQQWFPGGPGVECEAIARSLQVSFPYIRVFRSVKGWGFHFLASDSPIHIVSADQLVRRLPEAARADLLEWEPGVTARDLMKEVLAREVPLSQVLNAGANALISDDRPFNEYYLLRRSMTHYRRTGHL
jgi:spermidine synthase